MVLRCVNLEVGDYVNEMSVLIKKRYVHSKEIEFVSLFFELCFLEPLLLSFHMELSVELQMRSKLTTGLRKLFIHVVTTS